MVICKAQAAGKLFIAGEYAVVEPARLAILVAVNRFAQVEVQELIQNAPLGAQGLVDSRLYEPLHPRWSLQANGLASSDLCAQQDMAYACAQLIDQLLRERAAPRAVYRLKITSNLASEDGRKYGLGSSAAVSIACLKALNTALHLSLTELDLIKLGQLASWRQNPKGSGGDIAASVLGGWLLYASAQRQWVQEYYQQHGLLACLAVPWPGMQVQRLPSPSAFKLLVGWTGSPASTPALVAAQSAAVDSTLLDASDSAVRCLATAIRQDDAKQALQALTMARNAVNAIAQARGRVVETAALHTLCMQAQAHGAAAKTSGAGGGDCGIALVPSAQDPAPIYAAWRAHGIEPLMLMEAHADAAVAETTKESLK